MGDSVGRIDLDLEVNKAGFQKQVSGIQSMAKKAGAAIAAAFAVKKMVDFGAQCVELGSDLAEVQNVVDVTFPKMSKQVDAFAKSAAASFGLSETMAKKFTGTFGAMAKAFGFSEAAAYDMGTALTGLAGDVASFYNISQDEAYTKLKSVFTGETESLKDLGVVMTQAALDQYALANGYGRTVQAMSEAEKVALRYKFVTEQLSLASGDFVRTSDGWANQIRVLKLQFDSLKATIGQGLINVLLPVVKVINTIIGKLMSLANAFRAFTEFITGKKSDGGTAAAKAGMDAVAESAEEAGKSAGSAGTAAKKAGKDMKNVTTSIDELNIIDSGTGSGGGGGSSGSADSGYTADDFDMGQMEQPVADLDVKYQGLIDRVKELKDLFQKGFFEGLGDSSVFDSIRSSIEGIHGSLREVFTDKAVVDAANSCLNAISVNAGKIAGSFASIGATMADNLLGGLEKYLGQNSQRIKDYLVAIFSLTERSAEIGGNFAVAIADIFTAFRSDAAKQITADIIGIFSNAFLGTTELIMQFGVDIFDLFTAPFIENKELIRQTLEDTFSAVEPLFGEIKSIVDEIFDSLKNTYEASIAPLMESLKTGFTEIATKLLDAYNQYILPVLEELSEKFGEFREQYLSPLIDKFADFASKVAEAITAVWENYLKPFALFFIEYMAPVIGEALSALIDAFLDLWGRISEVLGYLLDALGGLMDFITGVFTGDWMLAWEGISTCFTSQWEIIRVFLETILTLIVNSIKMNLNTVKNAWSIAWNLISSTVKTIWNGIQTAISEKISIISLAISGFVDGVKQIFQGLTEFISGVFTGDWSRAWEGIKDIFKGIFNGIVSIMEGAINLLIEGINDFLSGVREIGDAISEATGVNLRIPTLGTISLPRLAQGGYVRANTPQLAMIGDNRHYGEIVAPEDKMQEMVNRAVAMASTNSGMSDYYLSVMVDLLRTIIDRIEGLELTVNIDIRDIRQKLSDLEKRSGYRVKTT